MGEVTSENAYPNAVSSDYDVRDVRLSIFKCDAAGIWVGACDLRAEMKDCGRSESLVRCWSSGKLTQFAVQICTVCGPPRLHISIQRQ